MLAVGGHFISEDAFAVEELVPRVATCAIAAKLILLAEGANWQALDIVLREVVAIRALNADISFVLPAIDVFLNSGRR